MNVKGWIPFVVWLVLVFPGSVAGSEVLQVEVSCHWGHRSFHDPLYLKLAIKNLGDEAVTLPEPKTDLQFRLEYQTYDHDLRHLVFRENHPSGGLGGHGVPEFQLEPMQQINFYFIRSLRAHLEDNEYYWNKLRKGGGLSISMSYYPRQKGKRVDPQLPGSVTDSLSHTFYDDQPEDKLLFDILGKSQDEGGYSLELLGYPNATISPSRLEGLRGQFRSSACNEAVELLLKIEAVRQAAGTEQIDANQALEEFLDQRHEIERQALTQYVIPRLPDRVESLKARLKEQREEDRIRPVESFE